MYYRSFNYKEIRELIKNHREKTMAKKLKSLISRKNSLLKRAIVELVTKGRTNKEISLVLDVEIQQLTRAIGSIEGLKAQLQYARTLRNNYKHESKVRKLVRSLDKQ